MSPHLSVSQLQLLLESSAVEVGNNLSTTALERQGCSEEHLAVCAQCQLELSRQAAVELELSLLADWHEGDVLVPETGSFAVFAEAKEFEPQSSQWSAMGGFLLMACCFMGLISWGVGNGLNGSSSAALAGVSCHQVNAWCH